MEGKIFYWSEKGYGFVTLEDGRKAFVHVTSITSLGPKPTDMKGRDLKEVVIKETEKGPAVVTATLIEEAEAAQPAVVISPTGSWGCVYLDGRYLEKGLNKGSFMEISLPSRARAAMLAKGKFVLSSNKTYLALYLPFNATNCVRIASTLGLKELFNYGDGHGMKWCGLYEIIDQIWSIDIDKPGHHNHGWEFYRHCGDLETFEDQSAARVAEMAKKV